ncbi:hypothetical protein K491DRAFT_693890 [Lophiostoma macrostomum CBS 122681]|uniref:Reverse transcriptase domain-containing protein n=1 Tax=Lophiostoma macrostomum CBS 122681 TaxID=1314788 RepID=A0A6A6T6A1_9PLEO|nr:hypothetical protein K491DRAFT_693890 [Lophiostoma macrostomum CBS 122681]
MASSGSVLSATLQTITDAKLEELAKQRAVYEERYASIISGAAAIKDPLKQLFYLVDKAKQCLGVKTETNNNGRSGRVISGFANNRIETDLKNLDRFLEQARYDPSISPKVLEDWKKCILQYLSVQSTKYQYAALYAKLVTEWLSSEKTSLPDGDVDMGESFEEVPGVKKMEARAEWEKVVFEPAVVDVPGLKQYLQDLFNTEKKSIATSIQRMRETITNLELTLSRPDQFSPSTLRWVIQGLQASDLLNNEKREVLKDFLSNEVILTEISDVLNMRISDLSRWTWGDHVPLEQRRKMNGHYSIHMHEDLLQAIFLHYIGVKWSVCFKSTLLDFMRAGDSWKCNRKEVSKLDRARREYYLNSRGVLVGPNLEDRRKATYSRRYFMHQLLDTEIQRIEIQEGEEEAEFEQFVQDDQPRKRMKQQHMAMQQSAQMPMQQMTVQHMLPQQMAQQQMAQQQMAQQQMAQQQMAQQQMSMAAQYPHPQASYALSAHHPGVHEWFDNSDNEDSLGDAKKPMQAKQGILHVLSTEVVINTRLHGELTCFRSVFESWNPLLPHDTILTVLEFFGVSNKWKAFFETFLRAPLKFDDEGSAAPRLRCRGTPGSHTLSDVFGEVILFCLDFAVNQSTDGGLLYRLYDDFWFWSHDYEKCATGWLSVLNFTEAMGVQLNEKKTGSVRIVQGDQKPEVDERLPEGEIRWGFLNLDPTTGRFEIDQKMVDSHVEELRSQLQNKSKSVIDWVQAWNSYAATFFSSNFGKPANCFGREHVDKMLATHRHIQERIFDGGNVVSFLKKTIHERFGVADVPDGFLFFPVELGGLDLKSPFVGLLQIREAVRENPFDLMTEYEESEREAYAAAKHAFDKGEIQDHSWNTSLKKWRPAENADKFFSYEEFSRFREEFCGIGRVTLVKVYKELLKKPVQESIDVSVQVRHALDQLRGRSSLRGITNHWDSMEAYWKWIAQMYGPETVDKFGSLSIVDPGLLPIGMVSMFRQKRIKWND